MTFSQFCSAGELGRRMAPAVCAALLLTAALGEPGVTHAQGANGAVRNLPPRLSAPVRPTNAADEPRITLNFQDADLAQIVEAVQMATHKTFILDPRVRAQVTMRSSTPVTPEVFYQTFLSILQVHSAIAVPGAGGSIKIIPDSNQRFYPGARDLTDNLSATSDEVVTQVIAVKNVSAVQLVTVLRPLVPTTGQINAYSQSNMIIVSDHEANVKRIERLVTALDKVGDADVEVIAMQNASATEVVRALTSLYQGGQGAAATEPGVQPLKLVADERSNSVLLSGEPASRLKARALIAQMDSPRKGGGETQVRYLHYADADKLATKLKEQISGVAAAAAGTGGAAGGTTPQAQETKNALIWADVENNALVITAPPKVRQQINEIIDQLDIRRAQVLVEAIIVDVDLAKSSELGRELGHLVGEQRHHHPRCDLPHSGGRREPRRSGERSGEPDQHQLGAGNRHDPGARTRGQDRRQFRGHAARHPQ